LATEEPPHARLRVLEGIGADRNRLEPLAILCCEAADGPPDLSGDDWASLGALGIEECDEDDLPV
jgi:hypothetical protein